VKKKFFYREMPKNIFPGDEKMKIVVAMSGGVDSSVAALKLKDEGHDVIGITMKTWPAEDCGPSEGRVCCSLEAIQYARSAAEEGDIPHYVVDLSEEFSREVRDYFVEEYSLGRTPNPCIYCNSRIKFGYLLKKAMQLGADAIATGHYARIAITEKTALLKEAADKRKDQSYFLCGITRDTLARVLFPLGEMNKTDVREIAGRYNLMCADRKSSQDICFTLPGLDYREYMRKKGFGAFAPGDITDIDGKVLGKHRGIASYTIGQRRGLGLGIHLPLYVVGIDGTNNKVIVGKRECVMKHKIRVRVFNWLFGEKPVLGGIYGVRVRYNAAKAPARFTKMSGEEAVLEFSEKQFAPTPGQAAVFYSEDIVAGGAWIEEILE
jgi:tRNA-uridine 2-sulfurtransferase